LRCGSGSKMNLQLLRSVQTRGAARRRTTTCKSHAVPNLAPPPSPHLQQALLAEERRAGRAREARHKLTVERLRQQLVELQVGLSQAGIGDGAGRVTGSSCSVCRLAYLQPLHQGSPVIQRLTPENISLLPSVPRPRTASCGGRCCAWSSSGWPQPGLRWQGAHLLLPLRQLLASLAWAVAALPLLRATRWAALRHSARPQHAVLVGPVACQQYGWSVAAAAPAPLAPLLLLLLPCAQGSSCRASTTQQAVLSRPATAQQLRETCQQMVLLLWRTQ